MTTSWSKLTTHDEAMRRAAGRRNYNSVRQFRASRRRVEVYRLTREYGLGHGVRQRIADEIGVSRSTISRDLAPFSRPPRPVSRSVGQTSTAEWIRALEPLGKRLAAQGCECDKGGDELRHHLGHVMRLVAESLDAAEDGKVELADRDRALLVRARDVILGLL